MNIVEAAEITTIFLDALLRNLDRKVVQDIIVSEAIHRRKQAEEARPA